MTAIYIYIHAGQCSNPIAQINVTTKVRVMGYEDPAFEGNRVTFTCLSGLILDGSNLSTCMGNGEWEPDSREVHNI